jgi:UDP-GlcNAc:undecaprenyl-phosphate GlcNAc-1-phosphate transferase
VNIGFSQRRTVLYLYAWTLCLAGMALALRFIPYTDGHGSLDTKWTIVLALVGVLVLIASFYLVIVLEILKLRRFSGRSLRRKSKVTPEEVDADVAEQLATGEFPALDRD